MGYAVPRIVYHTLSVDVQTVRRIAVTFIVSAVYDGRGSNPYILRCTDPLRCNMDYLLVCASFIVKPPRNVLSNKSAVATAGGLPQLPQLCSYFFVAVS